jgi:hypothetical protein
VAEFKCIRKCYYKGNLWKQGDVLVAAKGEEVPHHFIPVDEPMPEEHLPRLGAKVGKGKDLFPSLKAPGKKDEPKV